MTDLSDPDQTLVAANGEAATILSVATLRDQLRPALFSVVALTLLTGVLFPLMLFVLARPMFPTQAKGSLLTRDGVVIGSALIGQNFTAPAYFHPRPSAAGAGYERLLQAARISPRPTRNSKTAQRMIQKRLTPMSPLPAFGS